MKQARSLPPFLNTLLLYSPALVGVVIMLPRLADPQFGLFDDGQTITNALQVLQGNWGVIFENAYGRTRPIYWLFYTLIFKLAGRNPFWFFLVNAVVFIAVIVLIIQLVRSLGGSPFQAGSAGLLFAISDPVIENVYTLSKAEMLQMLLMLAAILGFARLARQAQPWKSWGTIISIVILTLLATLIKEVTLIGIAITAAWLILAWGIYRLLPLKWFPDRQKPESARSMIPALLVFLVSQGIAGGLFLVIRTIASGSALIQKTATSYAADFSFSLGKIASNFIHWSGWLLHDFPFLIFPILLLVGWILFYRKMPKPALILGPAIWMAAWFVFYLPWRFIVDYYLLPFSIGCAILCGVTLGEAVEVMKETYGLARITAWALLSLSLILLGVTLVNNVTNARIQLAVDDMNAAMLNYVASSAPLNSQVLLNLSPQSEYGDEIKMHLKVINLRPDLTIAFLNPVNLDRVQSTGPYMLITPQLVNQQILSVRMGVSEPDVHQANDQLQSLVSSLSLKTTSFLRQFRLASFDLPSLMCVIVPKTSYCAKNNTFFDRRLFTYGWTVYRANQP